MPIHSANNDRRVPRLDSGEQAVMSDTERSDTELSDTAHVSRELWIGRHVRRLEFGRFLGRVSEVFAGFCLTFGVLVLVAKLAVPYWWPHILWLALAAVAVPGIVWLCTRGARFTSAQSVVFLDDRLQAGGLLMALHETDDEQWNAYLPQAEQVWRNALPRIRPTRCLRLLLMPLLFAGGCCLVPLRAETARPQLHNTVSRKATAELEQLLDQVVKQQLLDEQQEEQLRNEIAELVRKTKHEPLTHENWETVDALREKLGLQLDSAARKVRQGGEAAQAALEAMESPENPVDPERAAEWEAAISEALDQLPQAGENPESLPSKLRELLKQHNGSGEFRLPSDLEQHAEALEQLAEFLDQEAQLLEKLREAAHMAAEDSGPGELAGEPGDGDAAQLAGNSQVPGQGDVTRGRGDAHLTYGDESDSDRSRFKSVVLPPGFLDRPDGEVVRVTKTAPTTEPAATAERSQQRQLDPASGRATWTRNLQPKHRRIVRQYFKTK